MVMRVRDAASWRLRTATVIPTPTWMPNTLCVRAADSFGLCADVALQIHVIDASEILVQACFRMPSKADLVDEKLLLLTKQTMPSRSLQPVGRPAEELHVGIVELVRQRRLASPSRTSR